MNYYSGQRKEDTLVEKLVITNSFNLFFVSKLYLYNEVLTTAFKNY